jgi:hypothetical protein
MQAKRLKHADSSLAAQKQQGIGKDAVLCCPAAATTTTTVTSTATASVTR